MPKPSRPATQEIAAHLADVTQKRLGHIDVRQGLLELTGSRQSGRLRVRISPLNSKAARPLSEQVRKY